MTAFSRLPGPARGAAVVVVVVLAYLLPYAGRVPVVGPQLVTGGIDWPSALFTMSYYVLLALGLNVVVGFAGLLDLGYVGFFAVGAYTVAVLASPDSPAYQGFGWLVCLPIAIALTLVSGVILGWPTLRLRGDYLAIVTLGFAEIIRITAENSRLTMGDRGLGGIPHPPGSFPDGSPIFSVRDATPFYWLGLTVVLLVVLGVRNLERSRVGRSWIAIREDQEAAEIMGVRTVKFKLWAFAIGAAIGGLGGVLFAGEQGFLNSATFQLLFSILVLAAVVMGGSGNIAGAILGGALISYLPDRLRGVRIYGTDAFEYRYLLFGLMIVLIMIFRPQGLIPSRRRALELAHRTAGVTGEAAEVRTAGEAGVVSEAAEARTAGERTPPAGSPTPAVTRTAAREPLLEVDDVSVRFGGVVALDQVSFTLHRGEILGLIGPNGAGKTTCFNAMTGVYRPSGGQIRFLGRPVTGRKKHEINAAGIARTFQNIRLFPAMTALENVTVGADARHRTSVPGALARLPRHHREERQARRRAEEFLAYVGIADRAGHLAATLSYGEQRRLEIARALATDPHLLCLDEPAAGTTALEKARLLELIRSIRDRGVTILLIEHDMRLVMDVTDRIVVLDFGRKLAEGSPAEIRDNPDVVTAYLGGPPDAA